MFKWLHFLITLLIIGIVIYGGLIGHVIYQENNVSVPTEYDSIIVLGAQVLPSGEPSVQLQWRLEKAFEAFTPDNPQVIVTCGAQGADEPRPEGDVMRDVLVEMGVPSEYVISETESRTTSDNISNALSILKEFNVSKPVIVTSDYHLPRAMEMAKDVGIENIQGLSAPTRTEINFYLKNRGREALAWVKYWLIKCGVPL